MKSLHRSPLAVAVSLSLTTLNVSAQEPEIGNNFELDPIVVTSTLGSETVNDSLSSVTVIDSGAMDRQQTRELGAVLRGQPGINVISNGSFGNNTSVFTRGTGSESTILLLDGIRIRSATSGGAPWQYIPPQLINRMEIVRGPRGTLYGADAVGGVVQGFTMPEHDRDTQWVEVGGGNFSTRQTGAGASGKAGNTRYSVQGNYFNTDGTRIREGGEDKGFRNASGTASVNHEFDNGASIGALGLHSRGNTEFDAGETDFVMQTAGVRAETPVIGAWRTSVQLSEARDEQDNEGDFGESFFDTRTRTARWENTLTFNHHQLIAGAEYLEDEVDSSSDFEEDSRDNTAAFAQFLSSYGPADLQLSARWDDNEAFGEETTGAVAFGFQMDRSHALRLSYGTAFRAPTFNDLYFPGFGNPDLDPETSATGEIGFRGNYNRMFWDLAIFQTDVDDLIQFDAATSAPQNIARARIRGAELTGGVSLDNLELRSALTVQDPRDRETDNRLARRSAQSARVDADYTEGRVSFGASAVIEGNRYNDSANDTRLSGFATADLRVGVQLAEQLSLRFNMDNMFNRQYSTARATPFMADDFDYLAAGRTVFVSLRYGAR